MKSIIDLLKFLWICFWIIAITLIMFLPITISALLSRTGAFTLKISNAWPWVLLKASFVTVEVIGKNNVKPGASYIIISNHQSFYDILAIVTHLGIPFRWIIKQELRKIPLFGYALHASKNVFVDRKDPESSVNSIKRGMRQLPKGVGIIFFAEGTRTKDGSIGPFKKGGFITAIETQRSILPVTIIGSREVLPKGRWVFRPGKIKIVVGSPISTIGLTQDNTENLLNQTRSIIMDNYNSYYQKYQNE